MVFMVVVYSNKLYCFLIFPIIHLLILLHIFYVIPHFLLSRFFPIYQLFPIFLAFHLLTRLLRHLTSTKVHLRFESGN